MRALVPVILVGVALAGAWGCDTFRPRRPEVPAGPPLQVDYSSPDQTLDTMRRGVENRTDAGEIAYMGALADSATEGRAFLAFLDPAAVAKWELSSSRPPPDVWDRSREHTFIAYFVKQVVTTSCKMVWDKDTRYPDVIGGSEAVLYKHYAVWTMDESDTPLDTLAIGYAALTVSLVSPEHWKVTRWQDEVDPAVGVDPLRSDWLSFTARRLQTY